MDLMFNQRVFPAGTVLGASSSVESPVISGKLCDFDGLYLKVTPASGNADVKIEFCISTDGITYNDYDDQDDISTSTLTDYATTPNDLHKYLIPRNLFIKLKITNNTGTAATVDGTLGCIEVC